jgi:lipopolysaccharide biosynthesis glycosyltransferase
MNHIALALHDKQGTYWPYIVTTLTSVFTHSSIALHVHILHDETFTQEARLTIEHLCQKHGHALTCHAIVLSPSMQASKVGHFSVATLYRLMLPQLLHDVPLVIYLDADLIFNQIDIADLVWHIENDPHQHPIAAVHDTLFTNSSSQRKELEMLRLAEVEYFNAGMLGLRPQRIDIDLIDALQNFIEQYPDATHIDQDLLNVTFRNCIHWLPERFNHQVNLSKGRYFENLESFDGKILHYTGKAKPLSGTFAPPDIFFWRYTHEVVQIHQFIKAPIRYLQQMHDRPDAVYLIPTQQRKP